MRLGISLCFAPLKLSKELCHSGAAGIDITSCALSK